MADPQACRAHPTGFTLHGKTTWDPLHPQGGSPTSNTMRKCSALHGLPRPDRHRCESFLTCWDGLRWGQLHPTSQSAVRKQSSTTEVHPVISVYCLTARGTLHCLQDIGSAHQCCLSRMHCKKLERLNNTVEICNNPIASSSIPVHIVCHNGPPCFTPVHRLATSSAHVLHHWLERHRKDVETFSAPATTTSILAPAEPPFVWRAPRGH